MQTLLNTIKHEYIYMNPHFMFHDPQRGPVFNFENHSVKRHDGFLNIVVLFFFSSCILFLE